MAEEGARKPIRFKMEGSSTGRRSASSGGRSAGTGRRGASSEGRSSKGGGDPVLSRMEAARAAVDGHVRGVTATSLDSRLTGFGLKLAGGGVMFGDVEIKGKALKRTSDILHGRYDDGTVDIVDDRYLIPPVSTGFAFMIERYGADHTVEHFLCDVVKGDRRVTYPKKEHDELRDLYPKYKMGDSRYGRALAAQIMGEYGTDGRYTQFLVQLGADLYGEYSRFQEERERISGLKGKAQKAAVNQVFGFEPKKAMTPKQVREIANKRMQAVEYVQLHVYKAIANTNHANRVEAMELILEYALSERIRVVANAVISGSGR